jgi:8-oxo-dGTP diphosphatase
LIWDAHGRVAVVKAPDGLFLPGGGIDEGESPEDALIREALEECGWSVRVGEWRGRAVQFALSGDGQVFYEKRCEFFDIVIEREGEPLEPGHETLWVTLEEARTWLKHESHAWAIEQFGGV